MYQFNLPDLGEGIAEAEVVAWHIQKGDTVQEDQLIVEVMTDKALMEITSPKAGRVHRLCGGEGDVIPVGQVMIEIDDADTPGESQAREGASEETGEARKEIEGKEVTQHQEEPADAVSEVRPPAPIPEGQHPPPMPPRPHARPADAFPHRQKPVDAVPAVRERARQLGVDIEQVPGTGPDGRVMRRDVEAFHERMKKGEPAPVPPPTSPGAPASEDEPDWTRRPLRGVRRLIAERLVQSKTLIPHYTYVEEIDVTLLADRRRALAEAREEGTISPLAFIAHAVVRVLPDFPQMNACVDEQTGEIIYKEKVHLGIAVATEGGLVVPVIRDAAGRNVAQLAATIRELSQGARDQKLKPLELKGSTFTMTSLGRLGGVMATPIINYPASAILGVHAMRRLPRYIGGQVQPRKILNLSISLDHRIVDGYDGARFVQDVKQILEQADFPEFKEVSNDHGRSNL